MQPSRSRTNLRSNAVGPYEHLGSLVDMFRNKAKHVPNNTVLCTEDYPSWTLGELDKVTDALAVLFVERYGAWKGCTVAIYMDKCAEYVLTYIAALKAGGGYLPLDISYPRPLLEGVLAEAKPAVVCTKPEYQVNLMGLQKNVFVYDHKWRKELPVENDLAAKLPKMGLDDLAYIVYSSGTTGQPKGIMCPHRGAVLSYQWRFGHYPFKDDDRVACNVFFVWEMFRPILQGVPMYIIPDTVIYDPHALCEFISKHKITRILFTPSLLQTIIDTQTQEYIRQSFESIKIIWLCGEVVTVQLMDAVDVLLPWVQMLNLYSVSECHDIGVCDLTHWIRNIDVRLFGESHNRSKEKARRQFAPAGEVYDEVTVAILNNDMQKQPIGVSGEIYVGGPTLAIGYLNRPEINKKRFIETPNELRDEFGARLYRTGDWGYLLSDGNLEICGRCDSMVKVRGYSVELQAIESTLLQLEFVVQAAVVAHGAEGEDKQLAAYLVLKEHKTKKELRATLKRRLPFYMIPTYFIIMESLPMLKASGKVDKKLLPKVDTDKDAVEPESLPKTETERRLAGVWMDILGLKNIDIQESFFDLGGHSLLAARLLGKIQEEFGVRLAVRDLFTHASVSSFATLLETAENQRCTTPTPTLNLEDEVEKHDFRDAVMDLHLRAFWRSVKMLDDRFARGTVLLTGATGFLGSSILRDLMRYSKVQCICLIRESASESAEARLKNALSKFCLMDAEMTEWIDNRITVVRGDVTLMQFGLSDDDYHFVSYEVDFVIHAAAYVNLIYPYQALHGGNVLGTQNVIIFCYANKVKPLHYVSSDAVVPPDVKDFPETGDFDDIWQRLTDGYGQSKWVAEQLVLRSQKRGLPVFIYRLGNQAPDTEVAMWNPADFTYLMLYGSASIGLAPSVQWSCEMTPVDFTSRFITKIATERFTADVGKIFHLVNRRAPPWKKVVRHLKQFGYEMSLISYSDWKASIGKALSVSDSNPNLRMLDRLLELYLHDEKAFTVDLQPTLRRDNTDALLGELGWTYPDLNEKLFHRWFKRMVSTGQMPRPLATAAQPLENRVCVVTGASGGIGEAIAYKLSVEGGAKVVVAARREDKLLSLCQKIKENNGIAYAVSCDVTNREQVRELMSKTHSQFGDIDILVNNAGIMYYTKMENCAEDQWETQIDVNCKGTVNCIGATIKGMVERKTGHIINISSDAGRRAFPGLAVYSGTKFFIEGMSNALREEVAEHNIKVTCIQPGDVQTELAARSTDMEARQQYDGTLGSHKVLDPEDIAGAVLFAARAPSHVAVNEVLIEPAAAPI